MDQQETSHKKKTLQHVLMALFILFLCFKFYTDVIRVKDAFFVDLRNRVIGTRLLKQDTTPYFFKWTPAYPMTLYDPYDRCTIKNNMTTAPPSLLLLMEPLASLSYTNFCRAWIVIHYIAFLIMTVAIFYSFKDPPARNFVLLAAAILLLTDQWRDSVFKGQSHFIFATLVACSIWMVSTKLTNRYLYAGLILAFLIWLRPNALLLLPFIFLCKSIDRRQLFIGGIAGLLVFGIITLLLGHQQYWVEFYQTCREWIRINTSGEMPPICPITTTVEGQTFANTPTTLGWPTETTDLFHLLNPVLKLNVPAMYLSAAFLIAYAAALFYCYKRTPRFYVDALLAGILLYWFSEITAPILRLSYYYVEIFVVVLVLAGNARNMSFGGKILLAAALVLPFVKPLMMNLTISELCTVACTIAWLLRKPFPKTAGLT